jgi:predicted nuclease with TOPRIM domain
VSDRLYCRACERPGHTIQACPEVRARLFAHEPSLLDVSEAKLQQACAARAYLSAELRRARAELDEAQAAIERACAENERLRREFQSLYAAARTLVQNAGPLFVALKQAADRAYMAAATRDAEPTY